MGFVGGMGSFRCVGGVVRLGSGEWKCIMAGVLRLWRVWGLGWIVRLVVSDSPHNYIAIYFGLELIDGDFI